MEQEAARYSAYFRSLLAMIDSREIDDSNMRTIAQAIVEGFEGGIKPALELGADPSDSGFAFLHQPFTADNFIFKRFITSPLHLSICMGQNEVAESLIRHGAGVQDPVRAYILGKGSSRYRQVYIATAEKATADDDRQDALAIRATPLDLVLLWDRGQCDRRCGSRRESCLAHRPPPASILELLVRRASHDGAKMNQLSPVQYWALLEEISARSGPMPPLLPHDVGAETGVPGSGSLLSRSRLGPNTPDYEKLGSCTAWTRDVALSAPIPAFPPGYDRAIGSMVRRQQPQLLAAVLRRIQAAQQKEVPGHETLPSVLLTALQEAVNCRGIATFRQLQAHVPVCSAPLELLASAVATGNVDLVQDLLTAGADPDGMCPCMSLIPQDAITGQGIQQALGLADIAGGPPHALGCPLHIASSMGHADVVQVLLEHGADSNAAPEGYTPLACAISRRFSQVCDVLLKRSDPAIVSSPCMPDGRTPMQLLICALAEGVGMSKGSEDSDEEMRFFGDDESSDRDNEDSMSSDTLEIWKELLPVFAALLQSGSLPWFDDESCLTVLRLLVNTDDGSVFQRCLESAPVPSQVLTGGLADIRLSSCTHGAAGDHIQSALLERGMDPGWKEPLIAFDPQSLDQNSQDRKSKTSERWYCQQEELERKLRHGLDPNTIVEVTQGGGDAPVPMPLIHAIARCKLAGILPDIAATGFPLDTGRRHIGTPMDQALNPLRTKIQARKHRGVVLLQSKQIRLDGACCMVAEELAHLQGIKMQLDATARGVVRNSAWLDRHMKQALTNGLVCTCLLLLRLGARPSPACYKELVDGLQRSPDKSLSAMIALKSAMLVGSPPEHAARIRVSGSAPEDHHGAPGIRPAPDSSAGRDKSHPAKLWFSRIGCRLCRINLVASVFDKYRGTKSLEPVAHLDPARRLQVMRFRRSHEAHRDAGRVFQAARDGRPLELQKRLLLGRLAGGLHLRGKWNGEWLLPLDVARKEGHTRCVTVLESALAD